MTVGAEEVLSEDLLPSDRDHGGLPALGHGGILVVPDVVGLLLGLPWGVGAAELPDVPMHLSLVLLQFVFILEKSLTLVTSMLGAPLAHLANHMRPEALLLSLAPLLHDIGPLVLRLVHAEDALPAVLHEAVVTLLAGMSPQSLVCMVSLVLPVLPVVPVVVFPLLVGKEELELADVLLAALAGHPLDVLEHCLPSLEHLALRTEEPGHGY